MQQSLEAQQAANGQEDTWHRVGRWHQDKGGKNTGWQHWRSTVAAGALLPVLSARLMPWSGVTHHSVAAGMEQGTRGMTPLLAVVIGTLSWLAAVVSIAAILLGVMLLLNALVQRYQPQNMRPSWDGFSTATAASPAVTPADQ